ncbi:hypothetical protein GH714_037658 [Hevea brasiliensis]|uniref:Uncharacterized protein n=1 Tax=Hevea brasiliensis TaxID=3981 RepID=A0A6A6MP77_HEVBR|nr:hypothetical protein GH714_037658 [Hevea brasiliensis]
MSAATVTEVYKTLISSALFPARTKGVGGLSSFLFDCKFLSLPESGSDDGFMTPDSVLEPAASNRTSSSSGGYGGWGWAGQLLALLQLKL